MRCYPLFMNLSGLSVLVAGAGEVGGRKTASVLACNPARLLWLDPEKTPREALEGLPAHLRPHPALCYEQRPARTQDAAGAALVFAASSDAALNRELAAYCRARSLPCNVADAPEAGSFIVPAHFCQEDFQLALSTGGGSPALARHMRGELEAWFSEKYAPLLRLLARLRPRLMALQLGAERNRTILRSLVDSGKRKAENGPGAASTPAAKQTLADNSSLGAALSAGNKQRAGEILRELLPAPLHEHIEELLS